MPHRRAPTAVARVICCAAALAVAGCPGERTPSERSAAPAEGTYRLVRIGDYRPGQLLPGQECDVLLPTLSEITLRDGEWISVDSTAIPATCPPVPDYVAAVHDTGRYEVLRDTLRLLPNPAKPGDLPVDLVIRGDSLVLPKREYDVGEHVHARVR